MTSTSTINCYLLILPGCLPLDLAGPLQVMLSANENKNLYHITYISLKTTALMTGGLSLDTLQALPDRLPDKSRLFIFGIHKPEEFIRSLNGITIISWLKNQRLVRGLCLVTVCSGALLAAKANWLVNKHCTTHHQYLDNLKSIEPSAQVEDDRLYVNDGNLWTSAGISSGIDMMLALLEQDSSPAHTARVARDLVLYLRRSGDDPQLSPYLAGRNHMNARIHLVQDLLLSLDKNLTITELAGKVNMSPRNLTRKFRQYSQLSIQQYREQIRIAHAEKLLKETTTSIETISEACGFQSPRSFRRAWNRFHVRSPRTFQQTLRIQV